MKPILSAEEIYKPLAKHFLKEERGWNIDVASEYFSKVIKPAIEAYHSQFNQSKEDYVPDVPAEDSASVASHSCTERDNIEQQQKDSSQ